MALAIPMTAPAWAVALAVCALLLASPAQAAVFIVNSTVDSVDALPGDAICADASGACTLRAAVMEANALAGPDVAQLPAGAYLLSVGGLGVTDDLTLLGGGPDTTTIDADGIDRVLSVSLASLSVHSLTITGGLASDFSGGGILCVVCDRLSVTNSTISGNVAEGPVESFFSKGYGGGVALLFAQQPAAITSTTISGNQAEGGGGGVAVAGCELTIRDSSISENTEHSGGSWGGGVLNGAGAVTLVNSTVSGNVGAGVASLCQGIKPCDGGYTAVYNSTISGNSGGGIHDIWGGHMLTLFALNNSVIGNQASGSDCTGGGTTSAGHNLDSDATCNLTNPTDLPNTDPVLGPLQDNGGATRTHALLPGSPAINAIPLDDCTYDDDGDPETPEVPLTKDQRGVARPQGDGCDIGAYEVTACADGIDNDGDAFIDAADPGCRDAASVREDPQCQDGINNDPGQDGLIDFDGGLSALGYVATEPDPQCVGMPWKNNEFRQPSCGLGAELALLLPALIWLRRRSCGSTSATASL